MPHDGHDHHHHHHHHAPADFGRAFLIGTVLNTGFVAAQVVFGLLAHSMALLADAVHNAGDVLGLLAAWGAAVLARRRPTTSHTYGMGRGTILASLGNAVVLLLSCGAIAVEAVRRFADPAPVAGRVVMVVAAIGILVNGGTALLFLRGRKADLNLRGAFLHMASDAGVSAGVVVAGLVIAATGWRWLDPLTSLLLVAIITVTSWDMLRQSVNLAMDGVPAEIDAVAVDTALRALPGVTDVHDLHVWSLSTTQVALTAHLVRDDADATLLPRACAAMHEMFGIRHATFQVETAELAASCALRPADVI